MKIKILSGILLISGVSFFTSCHGDLNVIQPSQFTSLSMWTEESDATSAVNGAYTQFRSAFSDFPDNLIDTVNNISVLQHTSLLPVACSYSQ